MQGRMGGGWGGGSLRVCRVPHEFVQSRRLALEGLPGWGFCGLGSQFVSWGVGLESSGFRAVGSGLQA